jgi:hypothetical protein
MNAHTRRLHHRCWVRHRLRWLSRSEARWHRGAMIAFFMGALLLGAAPGVDTVATADAAIAGWCATSLRPADVWNTLTVDMTVKRQRLSSVGDAIGAPTPNATYRIERSSRTGNWKTVVTVLSIARPPIYAFSGALTTARPIPVARLEDDENGSPVRAYDANGVLLAPSVLHNTASTSTAVRTIGQQWLDAFVATPGKKTARQQAFERAYGKATKVGTLNKYVHLRPNGSDEVLVDPKTVVPVESNTIQNGKRIGHRTFTYGPAPDSALVRTNIYADTVTTVATGDRAIADTAFSNVCLEFRR